MALLVQRWCNWMMCWGMTSAAAISLRDCNGVVQWVMGTFSQKSGVDGFIFEIPAAVEVMVRCCEWITVRICITVDPS